MDLSWIGQGLFSEVLGYLVILAGGIVLTWLRKRESPWIVPLMYGLCGSAIILTIIVMLTAWRAISPVGNVTSENIQSHVRTWVDKWQLTSRNDPDDKSLFRIAVTAQNGVLVVV